MQNDKNFNFILHTGNVWHIDMNENIVTRKFLTQIFS